MARPELSEPTDGVFVLACSFEDRFLAKGARFRWHPGERCRRKNCVACASFIGTLWWTDDLLRACELLEYADADLRSDLEQRVAPLREQEAEDEEASLAHAALRAEKKVLTLEASRAADAEIEIPAPAGFAYLPYQRAAIAFALDRENTLLADEMGLGKTIEALGVINADTRAQRVLIVCPASLKLNWARECERWLVRPARIGVAGRTFPKDANIVVINYDILAKWSKELRGTWDLLVVDECHYVKNKKAKRSRRLYGIQAERKLFLSGTPMLNRPIELWAIVNYLAPDEFDRFWEFAKSYCKPTKGRYGWDFRGATRLDELHDRLRSTIMVRRRKVEVLKDLPPKRRQVIELDSAHLSDLISVESQAWKEHQRRLAELRALSRAPQGADADDATLERLRQGLNESFGELAKLRQATALAKVPLVLDHLQRVLEDTDKIVVFAHHRAVIAELAAAFEDTAVTLTGGDSLTDRQAAVDRFQEDATCRLFLGSITAAGLGLTLTASAHVVFAELDWVPARLTQAEDRTHRIGQLESVLVQHLVLEDSLDARMVKTLIQKQEIIDRAIDGERQASLFEGPLAEALILAASAQEEDEAEPD